MRIYQNCSNLQDYENQSNILIDRFVEKGYKRKSLETLKEKVRLMDRNIMIEGKKYKKKNQHIEVAFLTGYNRQHKSVKVLKKHWSILQSDTTLKSILPNKPTFIYRRAPSVRNRLVHNALDPPRQI